MFRKEPVRAPKHINRKNVLNESTKFIIVEAYKTARTNLMFALAAAQDRSDDLRGSPPPRAAAQNRTDAFTNHMPPDAVAQKKTVVFTSCSPTEGKSTTAVNMALAFAQTGSKVLIIDGDMRKPTVHSLLRIGNVNGLSTILGRFCSLKDALNHEVANNLDVICAGAIPPNPAELLASPQMEELLGVLQQHYDYILVDTPPIGVVSDALLMNKWVAGIAFVVREGYTTHNDIAAALQSVSLADGKVLGFIKVGCLPKGGHLYKKYRYDYRYEYK